MTTQIAFMADENLKATVSKKLKQDWVTLKWFLTYCMKQYAQWKLWFELVSQWDDGFARYSQKELQKEIDNNKEWFQNLSKKYWWKKSF